MSEPQAAKPKMTFQEAGRLGALKRKQMREHALRLRHRSGLVTSISAGGNGQLKKAKRKILLRGLDSLDKRGPVAKFYQEMRQDLIAQYGGEDAITPLRRMQIETYVRGQTYLNHIEVTLHELRRLTNAQGTKALPLPMERFVMVRTQSALADQLGLEAQQRIRSVDEDLDAHPEVLDKEGKPIPKDDTG